MTLPNDVMSALGSLSVSEKETVESYIASLQTKLSEYAPEEEETAEEEIAEEATEPERSTTKEEESASDEPALAMYESGEDYELQQTHKSKATELKCADTPDFEAVLAEYTLAILAASPSPLLLANRAHCSLQLSNYRNAISDCDAALAQNPDSAKALRIRGQAYKASEEWELARKDLGQSQAIDFDSETAADLKVVMEKVGEIEKEKMEKRLEGEEARKKKVADILKQREEAKKEEEERQRSAAAEMPDMGGMPGGMGGMPGGMGGMPGGMGGMPGGMGGLADIMSDPEIAAGLSNPKVMAALSGLMSGGMPDMGKLTQLMADPEVGPILQKVMGKMGGGGGMPGMGGMPGGMGGGMPGMGGMPGGMGGGGGMPRNVPDADDNDLDFDDLPDLE